ncbi:MAG: segregation/condensation protein A [Clostridia bacterium]|nr:segregation/condensation protein A [Clostridia bacterium]
MTEEILNEKFPVKLEIFEGPLDLLMHLIKKNKFSIYDIPIVKITEQYLDYLDKLGSFDIELSSEFLVMAAELLLIKSKMLLPRHEEEEEEDPRMDLAQRLIAYEKIKKGAEFLKEKEFSTYYNFFKEPELIEKAAPDYSDQSFDIHLLLKAFLDVADKNERKAPPPKTSFSGIVGREKVSVKSRASFIKERLSHGGKARFAQIFEGITSRPQLVATFLALLEMIKLSIVGVTYNDDDIIITQLKDGEIVDDQ